MKVAEQTLYFLISSIVANKSGSIYALIFKRFGMK